MPPRSDKDIVLSAITKMAKGIKIGDLPYATLDSAIDVIGGGWTVEILTGTVVPLTDNQVEDLERRQVRGRQHTTWISKPDEGKFPKGTIQAFTEDFQALMQRLGATEHQGPPPASLPLGAAVWVPGGTVRLSWSDRQVTRFQFYLGVAAIRITAPSGDSVVEVATPRNGNVDDVISRGGFWTWAYKQKLDAAAKTFMELPENARPERVRRDVGELWEINTGTCGWCGKRQKLSGSSVMVLHGYKRPGDGWIQGECPGVGSLPYELSCDPCERAIPMTEADLARVQKYIADGGPPIIYAYERLRDIRAYSHREGGKPDGRVILVHSSHMSDSDQHESHGVNPLFKRVEVTRGDAGWKDVVRTAMLLLREHEASLTRHLQWLKLAVEQWRYRPQDIPWRPGAEVPWTDFCAATADSRGRLERAVDYVRQHTPEAYTGVKTRDALAVLLEPLNRKEITRASVPPFVQGSAG